MVPSVIRIKGELRMSCMEGPGKGNLLGVGPCIYPVKSLNRGEAGQKRVSASFLIHGELMVKGIEGGPAERGTI